MRTAISELRHLRRLEVKLSLDDWWSTSEIAVATHFTHLFLGPQSHSLLFKLRAHSSASLRFLQLELSAGWTLSPSFSLAELYGLEILELLRFSYVDLPRCLLSLSSLPSLRHLVVRGPEKLCPELNLAARLPPWLCELDLFFGVHPVDVLHLLQNLRFDNCALYWDKTGVQLEGL